MCIRDSIRAGQDTVVIFQRIVRFQCADLIVPLIMAHLRKPCIQPAKYLPHITDNAAVHQNIFINLCRVDIDLEMCIRDSSKMSIERKKITWHTSKGKRIMPI